MIDRPDNQTLLAIRRLKGLPEFEHVTRYLREQQEKLHAGCRNLTHEPLYRAQGGAQFVSDLLEFIEKNEVMFQNASAQRIRPEFKPTQGMM